MDLKECTTLCYLERDGAYLMMRRTKKTNDENYNKYIGVGGHLEAGETPEECAVREIYEETGLSVNTLKLRGLLTFVFENKDEFAWLFTSDDFSGELVDCNEGELEWISKDKMFDIPLWEGDKLFLKMLEETDDYFSLKLVYEGEKLITSTCF